MRPLLATLVLLLSTAPTQAQPLADRCPADALLYLGWAGADALAPAYANSHLKPVVDASALPELFERLGPSIARRLERETDPKLQAFAKDHLPFILTVGQTAWRHPTALYVGPIDFTAKTPAPRLALLCQAGKDAQPLLDAFNKHLAQIKPDAPIQLKAQLLNDLVVVANFDFPAKPDELLSARPQFQSAVKQGLPDAAVVAWFDSEKVINLISLAMTLGADAKTAQDWRNAQFATGLGGVKRLCLTAGFDGKDWGVQAFIETPKPRTGVLATLLSSPPLSDDLFKRVPPSATWLAATRFDAAKTLTALRTAVTQINPGAWRYPAGLIKAFNQYAGVDLEADLLANLGDQWLAFNGPRTGSGIPGLVLAHPLRDAAKFEKALLAVQTRVNADLAKNAAAGAKAFEITPATVSGLTVYTLAVPVAAPSWAVKDDALFVALFPQTLGAAATEHDPAKGSLLDNEDFQSLRKRLGVATTATSLIYLDLPKLAPRGYPLALAAQQALAGAADLNGIEIPPMILPPLNKITPHLAPALTATWSDDTGWHYRSVTPFPGAELLAGEQALLPKP